MHKARAYLIEQLKPLLPSAWRFHEHQSMPETIDRPTVIVKITGFLPFEQAPIGSLTNELTITIADPHTDPDLAEDALDEDVITLCMALDALERVAWSRAEKVRVSATYLGWDITTTIRTDKE